MISRRKACLLLVPLVLPVLLIFAFSTGRVPVRSYTPSGYNERVTQLIKDGKLVYDCKHEEIDRRNFTSDDEFFWEKSYLKADLERFSAGDRRSFFVDREELPGGGCRGALESVNPSFHKQGLPNDEPIEGWTGRLFLRAAAGDSRLSRDGQKIEILRPSATQLLGLPMPAQAFSDVVIGRNRIESRAPRLALTRPGVQGYFGTLQYIGDAVALQVDKTSPELFLRECPLSVGDRVRLDPGDVLRFGSGVDQSYRFGSGDERGLISFPSTTNGMPRRKTYEARLDIADDLVRAISTAVVEAKPSEPSTGSDFDVHLTLDTFYNDFINRALDDFCWGERYNRLALRAAVTMLDPETGRVVALGSYPSPVRADSEALRKRRATDTPLLARNHNFLSHPIGSATKPFLAAAALATRPELASLRIRCYPAIDGPTQVMGIDLNDVHIPGHAGFCSNKGDGFSIGLEEFLQISSNRYMLYLVMLAYSEWSPAAGSQPAQLLAEVPPRRLARAEELLLGSGDVVHFRPRLSILKEEKGEDSVLALLADQEFSRNLGRLFDIHTYYRKGTIADAIDLDLWSPVIDALKPGELSLGAAAAFAHVTPEDLNFKVSLIQHFRKEFYTTFLGGANNRWSNIQLAEALGRLLTGRRVKARLVEGVAAGGAPLVQAPVPSPERLSSTLSDADRNLILSGMAAVCGPGGTAAGLRLVQERLNANTVGATYSLFAKTGTPTLSEAAMAKTPTRFVTSARLKEGSDQIQSAVLILGVRRVQAGATSHIALAIYIEGQGGSAEAVNFASSLLPGLVMAYWPQDWLQ